MATQRRLQTMKDHAVDIVSAYSGIAPAMMATRSRKKPVAQARQIVIALLFEVSGASSTQVGMLFGQNHSTVLYASREVARRNAYPTDREYEELKQQLVAAMTNYTHVVELSDEQLREDARKLSEHALARIKASLDLQINRDPHTAIKRIGALLVETGVSAS